MFGRRVAYVVGAFASLFALLGLVSATTAAIKGGNHGLGIVRVSEAPQPPDPVYWGTGSTKPDSEARARRVSQGAGARLSIVTKVAGIDTGDRFNLVLDGSVISRGVGGSPSRWSDQVPAGAHRLGESTNGAASLGDYLTGARCRQGRTEIPIDQSSGELNLEAGQDVHCTVTNHRKTATISLRSRVVPPSRGVRFDLTLDTAVVAPDVRTGATTKPVQVVTGRHAVSSIASNGAQAARYEPSTSCKAGNGNVPLDAATGELVLTKAGQSIVCTVTNRRREGFLTVTHRMHPAGDTSRADVFVNGRLRSRGLPSGGSVERIKVEPGTNRLQLAASGFGTAAFYTTTRCRNGRTPVQIDGNGYLYVRANQEVLCTVTRRKQPAELTIANRVHGPGVGAAKVAFRLDGKPVGKEALGNGGTVGPLRLASGRHLIAEVGVSPTHDLSLFRQSTSCSSQSGAVAVTGGGVDLPAGEKVTCTVINIRRAGTLRVLPVVAGPFEHGTHFVPVIDGRAASVSGAPEVRHRVGTGLHSVAVAPGSRASDPLRFRRTVECYDASGGKPTAGDGRVYVGEGQDVVCRITSTRFAGTLAITTRSDWRGTAPATSGSFRTTLDGLIPARRQGNPAQGHGALVVSSGWHRLGRVAAAEIDPNGFKLSIACYDGRGQPVRVLARRVWVGVNQSVRCTLRNTRKTGTLTVVSLLKFPSPVPAAPALFGLLVGSQGGRLGSQRGESSGPMVVPAGLVTVDPHSEGAVAADGFRRNTTCVDGDSRRLELIGAQVMVGFGQHVTCRVTSAR
ncbi:MAG: hypothetical protein F2799_06215 [Actinobacteria bacterium]|uniref:Unannotated protein n=1 Tax=freshwater metagenome TaxID=449393 RepID=A0A6J7E838_9ZZZZ|nr:hypothetical protein [Actinomycetota bacterium]